MHAVAKSALISDLTERNYVTNEYDFLPLQAVVCHPPPPYECKKRMIHWSM